MSSSSSATALIMPPKKWDASYIPSQRGKFAIITGANSGVGYVTARELARKGAHVILACRSESKGQDAVKRIQEEISATDHDEAVGKVEFMQLDVSSLASVQTFATNYKSRFDRLNLLINNAGIMAVPYAETVDGYETQFATNHLGHFALTASLFDLLKAGTPSRVVNVSSMVHKMAKLNVNKIMNTKDDSYKAITVYSNTKLCNILFTLELARRLKACNISGVLSVAAHPGVTATNLTTAPVQKQNWFMRILWWLFTLLPVFQEVDMGALPTLYAATAPDVVSGQFFGPNGFLGRSGYPTIEIPKNEAHSEEAATKLWNFSEQLAKLSFLVQ